MSVYDPPKSVFSTNETPCLSTVEHTAALLSEAQFVALPWALLILSPLTQPAACVLYSPVLIAVGETEYGQQSERCGVNERNPPVVSVLAHVFASASVEPPLMASGICVSQIACRFVSSPLYVTSISLPPTSRNSQWSG